MGAGWHQERLGPVFVGVHWEPGAMGASGAVRVSSPWGEPRTWVHRSLALGGATYSHGGQPGAGVGCSGVFGKVGCSLLSPSSTGRVSVSGTGLPKLGRGVMGVM